MNADEGSLMNQITSALNKRRARRCEVGLEGPFLLHTELFELHRQGPKQTDLYGSDLAVTVTSATTPPFVKTAFFQFKIADQNQVRIAAHQLKESAVCSAVFERSFCLAVDPGNGTLRVEPIPKLRSAFPANDMTQTVTTAKWLHFTEWLIGWLHCTIGPWSSATDAQSIEKLLQKYAVADPELIATNWDLPRDYSPAKAWLSAKFERERG